MAGTWATVGGGQGRGLWGQAGVPLAKSRFAHGANVQWWARVRPSRGWIGAWSSAKFRRARFVACIVARLVACLVASLSASLRTEE